MTLARSAGQALQSPVSANSLGGMSQHRLGVGRERSYVTKAQKRWPGAT